MNWQTRRRLSYALATLIFICATAVYLSRDTLFPPPTCFDGKQNGYESGIDCGGTCSLVCKNDIDPLTVLWSRAIKVTDGVYDLVAMVSNKNINNASHATGYTFSVYSEDGSIIGQLKGTTTAPVDGDFPIIRQGIKISKTPVQVVTTLDDTLHFVVNEKPTSPTVRVSNEEYEKTDDISRVYARITNTKRVKIVNLPIRVVLFNDEGNAYAVGETIIPVLDKEDIKDISLTWDPPLPFSPTRIKVYPIFDPFVSIE